MEAGAGESLQGEARFKKWWFLKQNAIRFCVLSDFSFYDYTSVSYTQIFRRTVDGDLSCECIFNLSFARA